MPLLLTDAIANGVRDGLSALGLLTGLPTGAQVRPVGYLADENRGDEVTLRGLVTRRVGK